MSDFLKEMAKSSAERAAAAKVRTGDLDRPVVPLELDGFDVVAEIKSRSPAEGALGDANESRAVRAMRYAAGGAAAISVLTEPSRFDGALEHVTEVAAAVPRTPVMRKDFLVEPVQVLEARAAGASGVLLIATMLGDDKLREMLDCAYEHKLFVLLECFDDADLSRAASLLERAADAERAASGQLLVGVNTRNLRTLDVDFGRLGTLAPSLPAARCVAESGLATSADAAHVAGLGYRLALVGSALMRSDDPAALIANMRRAGAERLAV